MWRCSNCEYLNEDLDATCQKCGQERVIPVEDPPPDPQPALAEPVLPVAEGPPARERATANAISVLLIIACVLAFGAIGYIAWQRGLIGRIFTGGTPSELAATGEAGEDIWAAAPPAPADIRRHARPLRDAVNDVLAATGAAVVQVDAAGALDGRSRESLASLAQLGNDLTWQYRAFEDEVAAANDPAIGEYAQFVRDNVETAMVESLAVAATAYVQDRQGGHEVYLLSDTYVQAAEDYGLLDAGRIRGVWESALHARRQRELDQQYAEHYRQLQARIAALTEIHTAFNAQLSAMPPYKVRSGRLGKDARDLLTLLGELADKVQQSVVEFEEFRATLEGLEVSDRMTEYFIQFESLAKTDHLYAFEEIYKVYELDYELAHPVYQLTDEYYQFALDHWSEAAQRYREIYESSEQAWVRNWVEP